MTIPIVTLVSPKISHPVILPTKRINEKVDEIDVEEGEEGNGNKIFQEPKYQIDNNTAPFNEYEESDTLP